MSQDSAVKKNEFGPNYLGYYKHLFLELFSQKEELAFSLLGSDSDPSRGSLKGEEEGNRNQEKAGSVKSCSGSVSFFTGALDEGISEDRKDRLKALLDETSVSLNCGVDEILGQILAGCQIEPNHKEKVSCNRGASYKDMSEPLCGRKRKAPSSPMSNHSGSYCGIPNTNSVRQVHSNIQAIQGNVEILEEAEKYSNGEIFEKLDKMEQDLEEFLDMVVSKCRPMTLAEKQQLGRHIQKLPDKARHRVVEIFRARNFSSSLDLSDKIFINLEEQDDVTLWRLHYYVKTVMEANEL